VLPPSASPSSTSKQIAYRADESRPALPGGFFLWAAQRGGAFRASV